MARRRRYYGRKSLSQITGEATIGPLLWIMFICGGFMIAVPIAIFYVIILVVKEIYQSFR